MPATTVSQEPKLQTKAKVIQYLIVGIGLTLFYASFRGSDWQGAVWLHTAMEAVSTLLALLVGSMALIRYYARGESLFLIIGTAFLGTAILDGYHAVVTSPWVKDMLPSDLPSLIPWSWVASRMFLAVMLFLSWMYYKRQEKLGVAGNFENHHIFISALAFTVLSGLFFALVPLPRAYYAEYLFGRPEEFVPALFFLLALAGYLSKGKWKSDPFEHWLVLSLIVNFISQAVFMSFSHRLFDLEFDAAHTLKKVSYLLVLIGLYINMFRAFKNAAHESTSRLEVIDESLMGTFRQFQAESKQTIGIGLKMVVGTSILVTLATGFIGIIIFNSYTTAVVSRELKHLDNSTQDSSTILRNQLENLKENTTFLAKVPPTIGIVHASNEAGFDATGNSSLQQWKDRLGIIFKNIIDSNDEILQVRFIGIANNGLELVRADRIDGFGKIISDSQLQSKGSRNYFTKGIQVEYEEVYLSDVNLNREHGEIAEPHQPTIRSVTPILNKAGKIFGAIVLNLDLNIVFDYLANPSESDSTIYVINSAGNYVFHPNPEREFSFEFDHTDSIYHDYTGVESILREGGDILTKEYTNEENEKLAIGFSQIFLDPYASDRFLSVVHSTSMQTVLQKSAVNTQQAFIAGGIVIGFALVIAWMFSMTIANPLRYLAWAAKTYGNTGKLVHLPLKASGEVGVMARSLNVLHSQIEERADELNALIEEREKTNSQLQVAMEQANQATKAKSQFLATMSHEIRTPMNGLIGVLDLMESSVPKKNIAQLKIAQNSAEDLLVLINDILDFSKIEAGKLTFEEKEFDLIELMESISHLHSTNAFEKGLSFLSSPSPNAAKLVIGDPHRLRQVINNLVNNAIKFTSAGEVEIAVDLIEDKEQHRVLRFTVRDTGIGISKEAKASLFEAFHQANTSTTREFGGTGLGLSICLRIIELMNGEIGVESTPGVGSTFWVNIPLKNECKPSPISKAPNKSNMRVLLVEANRSILAHLTTWFEHWNIQVDVASNLKEVISTIRTLDSASRYKYVFIDFIRYNAHGEFWESALKDELAFIDTKYVLIKEPTKKTSSLAGNLSDYIIQKPVSLTALYALLNDTFEQYETNTKAHVSSECISLADFKVLLVDDNATNRLVTGQMLKLHHEADIDTANDGVQALEAMKKTVYDLVFMDCMMPVMDGYETTRGIRSGHSGNANESTPIIALTANALEDARKACIDSGMTDYLAKPVRPSELRKVIANWIGKRHPNGQIVDPKSEPSNQLPIIESVSTPEILNIDQLKKAYQDDQDLIKEVLDSFIEKMTKTMEDLQRAIEEEPNLENIRIHSHRLRGSAIEFGAIALGKQAKNMENDCINGNLEKVISQFEDIHELAEQTKTAIEDSDYFR